MPAQLRPCPSCGEERAFETPPCADGHGQDCVELACAVCGAALVAGPLDVDALVAVHRRRRRPVLGTAA